MSVSFRRHARFRRQNVWNDLVSHTLSSWVSLEILFITDEFVYITIQNRNILNTLTKFFLFYAFELAVD